MKMSKVDRNIKARRSKGRIVSCLVYFARNHQTLHETYSSFQDAIKARDEIEEVWRDTHQLKHSSLYQSGHLRNAKERYGLEEVEIEHYGNQRYYTAKCKCSKCSKIIEFRTAKRYQKFVDRGKICQSCQLSANADQRFESLNKNPKPYVSNLSTGVKNIYYSRQDDYYKITVTRDKSAFRKRSKSLEDAIRIKELVLKFYDEFGRLPSKDEIF